MHSTITAEDPSGKRRKDAAGTNSNRKNVKVLDVGEIESLCKNSKIHTIPMFHAVVGIPGIKSQ
jgi:hypothetical protein